MRSFWSDPYLWIHLAGFAAVPIWLDICLLALAVGDPALPIGLELFLVAAVGIVPIVWMQWQRPFDIYSLLAVSLKPEQLTEDQRKLLTLFTAPRNRGLAVAVAVLLAIVLQKLYFLAPIASEITPFAPVGRVTALLIAAIAFLGANLFTQVPVAVVSVLLTSEATYAATLPFAIDQVRQRFTLLGLPVNQILPSLVAESPLQPVAVAPIAIPTDVPPSPIPASVPSPEVAAGTEVAVDDLDDVWGTEAGADVSPPSPSLSSDSEQTEIAQQSDEKPDFLAAAVKTEEVKTEEVKAEVNPTPVGLDQPDTDSNSADDWVEHPATDDPASAEPPNSL